MGQLVAWLSIAQLPGELGLRFSGYTIIKSVTCQVVMLMFYDIVSG